MSEQNPTPRKPLTRVVTAEELAKHLATKGLSAREYVFDQLGEAPARSKDDLNGFGPGGENA